MLDVTYPGKLCSQSGAQKENALFQAPGALHAKARQSSSSQQSTASRAALARTKRRLAARSALAASS
jgi:hypothetical protein